jgi:hypothetical protein
MFRSCRGDPEGFARWEGPGDNRDARATVGPRASTGVGEGERAGAGTGTDLGAGASADFAAGVGASGGAGPVEDARWGPGGAGPSSSVVLHAALTTLWAQVLFADEFCLGLSSTALRCCEG